MEKVCFTEGTWLYDPSVPLGNAGGFGEVFLGKDSAGADIAVKRIKRDRLDKAHRELRIADELGPREFENVIKIIASGTDIKTGDAFIIMERAHYSLSEVIAKKTLSLDQAVEILRQVSSGLKEVGQLVHRDLKPANILFHDNRWKLADFGISKFVEESTSSQTLKNFRSPPYAAPEIWLGERATNATDMYALGCIAYCLINGNPPFQKDFREQHLGSNPPPLNAEPRLDALVSMMLRKSQETRPSVNRVLEVLKSITESPKLVPQSAAQVLANVGLKVERQESEKATVNRSILSETERRNQLAAEAYVRLTELSQQFFSDAKSYSPNVKIESTHSQVRSVKAQLGQATLKIEMEPTHVHPKSDFKLSGWNVIASGAIGITQLSNPKYEWWCSLWFGEIVKEGGLRWFEVGDMGNPIARTRREFEPFQLSHDPNRADQAASNIIGATQIALGPMPIDDEDFRRFEERWFKLFANAAVGTLTRPGTLPILDSL